MRDSFSKSLVELVKKNPKVYVLSGDHGYALFDEIRKNFPDHFINAGVAEQNMVGVGAGLSKLGFYPIIYGLSAFVPVRVLEQIKIDFCYEGLPGLFIGDGAGVVYSHLGASHQSTEDVAALRGVPGISILSPCDKYEFEACFNWAIQQKSPVYIRMGKADLGLVHREPLRELNFSPIEIVKKNQTTAIFATGSMVRTCLDVIEKNKLALDLYSVPVIKAPQSINLETQLQSYKKIITVEEHSVAGGLGDLVAAAAAEMGGIRVRKIGIADQFSNSCGTYQHLMKEHGLDPDSLLKKISSWL